MKRTLADLLTLAGAYGGAYGNTKLHNAVWDNKEPSPGSDLAGLVGGLIGAKITRGKLLPTSLTHGMGANPIINTDSGLTKAILGVPTSLAGSRMAFPSKEAPAPQVIQLPAPELNAQDHAQALLSDPNVQLGLAGTGGAGLGALVAGKGHRTLGALLGALLASASTAAYQNKDAIANYFKA